jgi:hypothetical protein
MTALELVQFLATFTCALFAGAAVYVSLVEHPARMGCGTLVAATQWAPSYRRGTVMQASLAVLSTVFGVSAWLARADRSWLVGALLIGIMIPYTLIVIMPTNKRLLLPGRDLSSPETARLLQRWGKLHAFRSVFSTAAFVVYLFLLTRV